MALARAAGLEASREWQNAQAADPAARRCDVRIAGKRAQVKLLKDGFGKLYDALQLVELAFVRYVTRANGWRRWRGRLTYSLC